MTVLAPWYIPATAHPPPPMWNSGMATRFTLSGRSSHIPVATGRRAKKLSLDSITPLGRPVVPLEYSWKATSSLVLGVCGSTESCWATHSS